MPVRENLLATESSGVYVGTDSPHLYILIATEDSFACRLFLYSGLKRGTSYLQISFCTLVTS